MEYIDKKHLKEANAIIDDYLKWAKENNCEERYLYNKISQFHYKGNKCNVILKNEILLPEQNNRCCYCMRKIDDESQASIEHIIPQSVNKREDLNKYFSKLIRGLDSDNLCLTEEYIENGWIHPPYPLKVAYYNFAASCLSNDSCNNKRKNEYIEPIIFNRLVGSEVVYDSFTGSVEWTNDPINKNESLELPTLEKLGLNNIRLKVIRALWGYLYRHKLKFEDIGIDNRKIVLYEVLGEILEKDVEFDEIEAIIDLVIDNNWNKASKYDYFYR